MTIGLVGTAALAAGLVWFQPWKLWVDHRVNEDLPAVALQQEPAADVTTTGAPSSRASSSTAPASTQPSSTEPARTSAPAKPVDRLVARGKLISHEHSTRGRVSIVERADGSRVLAIAGLVTSDGPDVQIWLTDAPVIGGEDGWYVFDDGAHVSLGELKGNLGNQVYEIPDRVDLTKLTSVSLWCARFDVSFGAAELSPIA